MGEGGGGCSRREEGSHGRGRSVETMRSEKGSGGLKSGEGGGGGEAMAGSLAVEAEQKRRE